MIFHKGTEGLLQVGVRPVKTLTEVADPIVRDPTAAVWHSDQDRPADAVFALEQEDRIHNAAGLRVAGECFRSDRNHSVPELVAGIAD